MDAFETRLRQRARTEPFSLPEQFVQQVQATCDALPEKAEKPHRRPLLFQVAAVLAILLVSIPNLSPAAARAMQQVPILGRVVEVITLRHYLHDDPYHQADVSVPQIQTGSQAGQAVNGQVQADTDRLIAAFEADMAEAGYQGLDVQYAVVTDTADWFTLRVDVVQTMASGAQSGLFYHIDKRTDEVVTLADLFAAGSDYVSALSAEVLRQMQQRMQEDETAAYFPEELTAISPEQNFYWNADGNLVLVFDEYTIAAGFMGMPEFVIPESVLAPLQ